MLSRSLVVESERKKQQLTFALPNNRSSPPSSLTRPTYSTMPIPPSPFPSPIPLAHWARPTLPASSLTRSFPQHATPTPIPTATLPAVFPPLLRRRRQLPRDRSRLSTLSQTSASRLRRQLPSPQPTKTSVATSLGSSVVRTLPSAPLQEAREKQLCRASPTP